MEMKKTTTAASRGEWRAWLEANHAAEKEVWLVYYRKGSGKGSVTYRESLEEALCFGWIDSLIQRIDDEKYARKFNPRRADSQWSPLNRHLAAKLLAAGLMTPAGMAAVTCALPDASQPAPRRPAQPLPDWLQAGLKTSPAAWNNFSNLPASEKYKYIGWISAARRDETRQRRMTEAIGRLEKNERLGMK